MVQWIVLGIVVLVALVWIYYYNSFVRMRNWVKEAGSQIDVQLKRRHDLIPNLVETVKGYVKHEQETLKQVIELRNKVLSSGSRSEQLAANEELSNTLKSIFALQENYPELKANQSFLKLQEQLEGTENKIASARQIYNTTVMEYNTRIQTFPSSIIASVHGFKEEELLEATEAERQNVQVKF